MSTKVHPNAVVYPGAKLGNNVDVGPFAVIGSEVKIGSSTVIDAGVHVLGNTKIGNKCHIFSHAVIGSISQDLKHTDQKSFLEIGNNNLIREFVTINSGTEEGSKTVIGNNNLFMAYTHIAHDCVIGNDNVLANCATLAGHVTIEDKVIIGGLAAVHQFCRLGVYSIVGGCSKVVQDIPPYSMCDGHPAVVRGINSIGLRRNKFSSEKIKALKQAFKILFFQEHTLDKAKKAVKQSIPSCKEVDSLLKFVSSSKRGIGR